MIEINSLQDLISFIQNTFINLESVTNKVDSTFYKIQYKTSTGIIIIVGERWRGSDDPWEDGISVKEENGILSYKEVEKFVVKLINDSDYWFSVWPNQDIPSYGSLEFFGVVWSQKDFSRFN